MSLRLVLAALGLVEVLWPRRTVDFWMGLAVKGAEDVEIRPWVYAAARVEGILILLLLLARARGDRSGSDGT